MSNEDNNVTDEESIENNENNRLRDRISKDRFSGDRFPSDRPELERRDVLRSAGLLGGAAAVGAVGTGGYLGFRWLTADEFLEDVDRNATEIRAQNLNNGLERAEGQLEEINGNRNVSTEINDYQGRGVALTPNFRLRRITNPEDPDVFTIPAEDDGDNIKYTFLENTELAEGSLGTVRDVLDTNDDGVMDVPLSGRSERRIEQELEDFNNIALYIAENPETSQPELTDEQLDTLEEQKEFFDEVVGEYQHFIVNSAENSPHQISEGATDLIYDEIGEASTSRYVNVAALGVIQGSDYHPEDRFTTEEAENLIDGEGQYEDFGLEQTKEQADELIIESSIQAGKAAVLSNALGYALQEAGRQAEIYDHGDFDRTGERVDTGNETAGNETTGNETSYNETVGDETVTSQDYAGCDLEEGEKLRIEDFAEEKGVSTSDLEYQTEELETGETALSYGTDISPGGEYDQMFIDGC